MALEVDTTEVTGGYRIIDTDRHLSYQGVALVIQRDAHPTIRDCEISHEEALYRAKVMAASQDLFEALEDLVGDITERFDMDSPSTNPGMKHAIESARAAIRKATA